VLSVDGLVQAVEAAQAVPPPGPAARRGPPVLVIDDSLTTRMLQQGILETAGYDVDTASSGEEALEKARRRQYGVFIVDLEMPGMDGFTFIRTASAERDLRDVPSIVLTSRDSPGDRAMGTQVGAKAYIVKSAFDERVLLKTIHDLIG
jgi:two-component system chemotaxis sensor kinase CheA